MRTGPRKQRHERRVNTSSISQLATKWKKSGSHNDGHKEGKVSRGNQKRWTSADIVFFEEDGKILLGDQRSTKEVKGFIDQVPSLAHLSN